MMHIPGESVCECQVLLAFMVTTFLQSGMSFLTLSQSTKCRIHYHNLSASFSLDSGCNHVTCGTICGALCPGSRDCQQNGVIVCRVAAMLDPFECGYDNENCYIFHRIVSGCTNGGSVSADGTCVCPPGYMGQFCHQYVHTCHDIYMRERSSVSGEYILLTYQDVAITVWCSFQNDVIVTYFPKSAIASLTTQELSLHFNVNSSVDVVAKWSDGTQKESTLEQITSYSDIPLSVQVSEYIGYASPQQVAWGPYLYLGFIPQHMTSLRDTQGYRSNGVDKTFTNCDANPNAYFVFYVDPDNKAPASSSGNLQNGNLMSHWNHNSRMLSSGDLLPDNYFLETEIHFGGCGGLAYSYNWADVDGLCLGIKHTMV